MDLRSTGSDFCEHASREIQVVLHLFLKIRLVFCEDDLEGDELVGL